MGANGYPNGVKTIEDKNIKLGKVVPKVSNVLSYVSKSSFIFSAMNIASECSNPVRCNTHEIRI